MSVVVGVDVGGSKVLAAVVSPTGDVVRSVLARTPGRLVDAAVVEDVMTDAVRSVADGEDIAAIGVAAAGFVDQSGERVVFAPHLPWRGEQLRGRLTERWGVPVALDNDANCTAVAEATYGVAGGDGTTVVVTMGTGIGGAILVEGRVLRGRNGMAGEFGHMRVVPDGQPCECGGRGCWEQYASGGALVRYARAQIGLEPSVLTEACGGDPDRLTGPMVTDAAGDGDLVARQAFGSVGHWLGVGLANLVAALDPHRIVVGGGVSAAGDRLLDPARVELERSVVAAGHRAVPPVLAARLGPEAGAVGAAELARRSL
ncbi:ROK family protein [Nocardioides sp.]|uniref:ROK family protein n=1 Tax=Nocardioides sp. TaxID=35761 RepID=UPI002D7E1B0E|nr:ROK family protein [Nocardioides sp.]HET8960273.1 ROK family protein [Nocardioides sp.]